MAPSGKRLAPFLGEIVDRLIAHGEVQISDAVRYQLVRMSAATIDRRLAADRARWVGKGRSLTKPGSLLKAQIPIRTWRDWDDAQSGFVEIDLVGHEGGDPSGQFAHTLTVTDIATGWTETRAVPSKARKWVLPALIAVIKGFPFPVLGIDSDNGSEFINRPLLDFCERSEITFTRSRPGNSNDGAHVEQKNWSVVRHTVGYHRYTGPARPGPGRCPQRHLRPARPSGEFLYPATKTGLQNPPRREDHQTLRPRPNPLPTTHGPPDADIADKAELHAHYLTLNPAMIRRDLHALTHALTHMVTTPTATPYTPTTPQLSRTSPREATTKPSQAP